MDIEAALSAFPKRYYLWTISTLHLTTYPPKNSPEGNRCSTGYMYLQNKQFQTKHPFPNLTDNYSEMKSFHWVLPGNWSQFYSEPEEADTEIESHSAQIYLLLEIIREIRFRISAAD